VTGLDLAPIRTFLDERHAEPARAISSFADTFLRARPEPADDDAARREARTLLIELGNAGAFAAIGAMDWRGCCRAMAAFAMTEAEAGSDVASMKTRARRDGADYVLDGAKCFISNAGIADYYTVFATTDPAAGGRGIGCFVVPAGTPGLSFVRSQVLSAPHPLGEIAFEGCRVPVANRLGEEGKGFALGLKTLDRLRATVGAAACGMATRALHEALAHARQRRQFGKPLGEFQLVQEKLARMATELTAARLMVYRAAHAADAGAERVTLEAAMAKLHATEGAQRIVDDAVQVLGGRGVLAGSPVDRLYRSVRALRIYEGTSEVQHLVIARLLLEQEDA